MMARCGSHLFEKLLELQLADNAAKNPKHLPDKKRKIDEAYNIYNEILAEGQPYLIADLVVNGRDLIKIGYRPGRSIGDALKTLIDEVIINPELNTREYLLMRAKEIRNSLRTQ